MKTLDRYIAKNFAIGYAIAFGVLIGLRIIIDLFVNLDEFTEHAGLGTLAVFRNIFTFYGLNSTVYFRDFAGMITVNAAAFSLGQSCGTAGQVQPPVYPSGERGTGRVCVSGRTPAQRPEPAP